MMAQPGVCREGTLRCKNSRILFGNGDLRESERQSDETTRTSQTKMLSKGFSEDVGPGDGRVISPTL